MPKLYVLEPYHSNRGHFQPGAVLDLLEDEIEWFMNDAPDCFSLVPPDGRKALAEPPQDKMLAGPPVSKMTVVELRKALKRRGLSTAGNKATLLERLENAG